MIDLPGQDANSLQGLEWLIKMSLSSATLWLKAQSFVPKGCHFFEDLHPLSPPMAQFPAEPLGAQSQGVIH